jgi:hypothetical protein
MTGPETFSMPNLGAASASVPMQMTFSDFDSASQTYTHTVLGTATATIQWTGVGAIEKIKEKDKIVFPNGDWLKISLKGNSRAASVAGTFILNGEDLIAGITSDASLTDVTFGSHTKSKN